MKPKFKLGDKVYVDYQFFLDEKTKVYKGKIVEISQGISTNKKHSIRYKIKVNGDEIGRYEPDVKSSREEAVKAAQLKDKEIAKRDLEANYSDYERMINTIRDLEIKYPSFHRRLERKTKKAK